MMIYQSGFVQWNALLPSLLSRHLHYLGVPNIPCVLSGHFYDSRVQRIGCGRHKGRAPRDKGLQEEFQTDGQTNKAGASRWQERDANRVFLQDHCALVRAAKQKTAVLPNRYICQFIQTHILHFRQIQLAIWTNMQTWFFCQITASQRAGLAGETKGVCPTKHWASEKHRLSEDVMTSTSFL